MIFSELSAVNKKSEIQNAKFVKDGSTVLVRVNKDSGNGKYEGVVGGVKINFSSRKPLIVGKSFVASITKKDGKIILIPKEESNLVKQNQNEKINGFTNFLKNNGLNVDDISIQILKQFKQMQLPFETGNIKKIYNQSVKYKGKEKKVAELLSIFNEKNVILTSDEIIKVLDFIDGDFNDEDIKDKINKFNIITGSWYIFPYYLKQNMDDEILGKGNIKLLFDKCNKLKLLNILCNYKDRDFLFNLKYEENNLYEIDFYISGIDEYSKIKENLASIFNNVKIEVCNLENICFACSDDEEFFSIDGEI